MLIPLCEWEKLTGIECKQPANVRVSVNVDGIRTIKELCEEHGNEYAKDMRERLGN